MIKKIINKVFYAIIIALVFTFINRGCAKALDTPFYLTGSLNFNIARYDSDSSSYYLNSRFRRYDFTKLYEDNVNYFNNYNYFFIIIYSNPNTSNYFIIELDFANRVSNYGGPNSWLSGDIKRLRYNSNVLNNNDDIFGSDTFTITNKIDESNQTYINVAGYYGMPYYDSFNWNQIQDFENDFAIPLVKLNIYNYYAIPKNPASNPRFVIFSNYYGNVLLENSTGNYSQMYYSGYIGEQDVNFDIKFSVINSSDNSEDLFGDDSHITGAGIGINYFPKDNELYNYYYYFEEDIGDPAVGPPENYSEMVKLEDSERGIGVAVVNSNGWLYAFITDKNNNRKFATTLHYTAYGSISTIPVNNNKVSTWLDKFSNNINYGGPINSILTIPINLISTLYNSFGGTCQSYNLGSLLGHNVVFNCFTLESILGNTTTNIIDILCSFFIYYHLILFIISIYRKVMNLEDLDDYLPQHMYHPKHGSYEDYNS